MAGRDCSKHENNWGGWTHWTDLCCLLMFKNKKTPLIQVLCPWILSSSVQGIGMIHKAKKSDTMKKRIVKEVDFSGRNKPEPVKGNTGGLWGWARGHSCQMGPERNTWLLPREWGFWERRKAGPRWWRRLRVVRKTAGAGNRRAHQAPWKQPCPNESLYQDMSAP